MDMVSYLMGQANGGGGGGGLPPVTGDGKALVSVNGEWTQQSGYGYETSAFEPITWDGNTEGHTRAEGDADTFYKVSDVVLTVGELNGCIAVVTDGGPDYRAEMEIYAEDFGGLAYSTYVISGEAGNYDDGEIILPESGTYCFCFGVYVESLTAPTSVHKIDEKYIPGIVPTAPETNGVALVSVNGKWTQQSGYGYDASAFAPITWDGDTTGKISVDNLYKVSDQILSADDLIGSTMVEEGHSIVITPMYIYDVPGFVLVGNSIYSAEAGTYDIFGEAIVIEESGTYFHYADESNYVSSLTPVLTAGKIDEKYLPEKSLSNNLKWGRETHGLLGIFEVNLPTVEDTTVANEITYIFTATDTTYSFTAPDGYILGDDSGFAGLTAGNTITYTDMVIDSVYEISFKVLDDTHIGLVMKEWKTA